MVLCGCLNMVYNMEETSNKMSNISKTDYRHSRNYAYFLPQNKPRKQEAYKIRTGEILKGTVLNVENQDIAEVRLPNGTYRCELHNKLIKNDELYFKVASIQPNLVLKVHSVASKINGKETNTEKIIRILDLEDSEFIFNLIDFLKVRKSIIIRDEVLVINRNYNDLTNQNKTYKTSNEIIRTLFWLMESGIKGNNNNFKNYFPLFRDGDFIKEILINIYKDIKFSYEAEEYRQIIRTINLNSSADYLLNYFSKGSPLTKWLDKIISDSKAPKSAIQLWNILQSMHYWNDSAYVSGNTFQFFFPVHFGKSFITVKLILTNFIPENNRNNRNDTNNNFEPASVLTKNNSFSDVLIKASNSYEQLYENLLSLIEKLNLSAKYNNISIQALILIDENGNEKDILPLKYISTNRNFSIVV